MYALGWVPIYMHIDVIKWVPFNSFPLLFTKIYHHFRCTLLLLDFY